MNIGDLVKVRYSAPEFSKNDKSENIGIIIDIYDGEHGEEYLEIKIKEKFVWYAPHELILISHNIT